MLNSHGESRHLCSVPDLRRKVFRYSPLNMMFAVGFLYMFFIMLRCMPVCSVAALSFHAIVLQALLFVGFSRQEYWIGLPFPSPGCT